MSSTNKTSNLELSQFIGSDSPKWLTDYNADMEKIDTGYQTVKAQADATDLIVSGHTSSLSSLQTTVTEQGTAITGLRTDVTANSGSINTINSLIGNGTPTTTDQTIIGAINEINANVGSLSSLSTTDKTSIVAAINEVASGSTTVNADDVTYSNTSSGLTATNVQDAIDEIATSMPDNEIVIVSASVTGSEQAITPPTGYDYTTACIVFTNYYTGQRVFPSGDENDADHPSAYLHSNGNIVINANSSSGNTVYIGLIKHS